MTPAEMENRIVRYGDLQPCKTAFIDAHTPGSDQKENFTIIGGGVSESPDQHVHITDRIGFVATAVGDHPELPRILRESRELGFNVALSSLRIPAMVPDVLGPLAESGARSVTIAPETGSVVSTSTPSRFPAIVFASPGLTPPIWLPSAWFQTATPKVPLPIVAAPAAARWRRTSLADL